MRFSDIIAMSVGNLWKRKIRTVLTVMGVVIGTASIVVMLSLGLGLKSAMLDQMKSEGGMTEIQIYSDSFYGEGNKENQLTDETIEELENLEHVKYVTPQLSVSGRLIQGRYESWVEIIGVTQEYLQEIPLEDGGTIPSPAAKKPELIYGNQILSNFYDSKTYEYTYDETGELPDVDLVNRSVFVQLDSNYVTGPDGESVEIPARKVILPTAGVVEGGTDSYNQFCWRIYTDIDSLKKYLKDTYRGQTIPGQPTDKQGNPYRYFVYRQAIVMVDDFNNVEDVQKTISDMGYEAYSSQEWIKEAQKELVIIEAVLGGIGAISLFVAAIGIANTMMMSIYERTKEIGVMKVLGCSLGNIRAMFLTEAAFIGFIGGVIGLLLSYILSFGCNLILPKAMGYDGSRLSVIPLWLVLLAIIFSTVIGMVAGFFPAQRATKLSPLAAIRNE